MSAKIGIFSGTFDPVHNGHIAFAREAASRLGLEAVYFLVEPKPRHKKQVTKYEQRIAMAELATVDEPRLFVLRAKDETFSTAHTLPKLKEQVPGELYMLMGTDVFSNIEGWRDFELLKKQVHFVVGQRMGQTINPSIKHVTITTVGQELSSSVIRTASNDDVANYTPQAVADYIYEQQLYS